VSFHWHYRDNNNFEFCQWWKSDISLKMQMYAIYYAIRISNHSFLIYKHLKCIQKERSNTVLCIISAPLHRALRRYTTYMYTNEKRMVQRSKVDDKNKFISLTWKLIERWVSKKPNVFVSIIISNNILCQVLQYDTCICNDLK